MIKNRFLFASVKDSLDAMDRGDLEVAERCLFDLRAADPNRDMPPHLHTAFIRLFHAHAAASPTALWPLEGLAALHTDAEEWEECLAVTTFVMSSITILKLPPTTLMSSVPSIILPHI